MKDYRLRIGMHFVQEGNEFVIEGPLPNQELRIRDTATGICSARSTTDLLNTLFAGQLELTGEGDERQRLLERRAQTQVSDLTLLEEGDPLKAEAVRRLHYVQAVIGQRLGARTREILSPIVAQVGRQIQDAHPPSWSTVKRWCRIYERAGEDVRALVPAVKARGNRRAKYSGQRLETFTAEDQQKALQVSQIIEQTIRAKYLSLERPSVASVHASVMVSIVSLNRFHSEVDKLPVPHLSSIYPAVRRLDPYEVALGRYGKRFADEKFRDQQLGPRPLKPLERVECDDTKIDLLVIDPETRLPLGRPWLTTMIDVCTKMITGFYVSFHPPGYLNVMQCLLHAVRPKSYLKAAYPQIEHDWPAYGVPEVLVVDNAKQFHSTNFELACRQLGTRVEYAPPRTPWYKASIERWFETQNQRLLHELPGTTFSNVLDRDQYDPQKHAVISIDALLEMIHLWVVDLYHQTVHRSLRDLPYRRWVEAIKQWPPNLPPRSSELEVLLGFTEKRAITASGIELFTLRYNCAGLAALRRNLMPGEKVTVRYDPQDISVIYVHDQARDRMIPVPALDQDYTRKLTIWQHHIIRQYARRIVEDHVDIEALCRTKEKIQQLVERERLQTGKMKRKQKVARYLNLGQKIAAGLAEADRNAAEESAPACLPKSHSPSAAGTAEAEGQNLTSIPPSQGNRRPASAAVSDHSLPLDERGWNADYSLRSGPEEVIK